LKKDKERPADSPDISSNASVDQGANETKEQDATTVQDTPKIADVDHDG